MIQLYHFWVYMKANEITVSKKHLLLRFIATQFTITLKRKQHKTPSTNGWIKKTGYMYTREYCHRKNKSLSYAATLVEPEDIMLLDKSNTERYIPHVLTCLWKLKS